MGLQSLLSIKARLDRMERRMSKLESVLKRQGEDSEDSGQLRTGSATPIDRVSSSNTVSSVNTLSMSSVNTVSTYEEGLCARLPAEAKHRRPRANSIRSTRARGVQDDDETGDSPYSQLSRAGKGDLRIISHTRRGGVQVHVLSLPRARKGGL